MVANTGLRSDRRRCGTETLSRLLSGRCERCVSRECHSVRHARVLSDLFAEPCSLPLPEIWKNEVSYTPA